MANVRISELPAATLPLTGGELVPLVQGGVTKQTTAAGVGAGVVNIKAYGAVGDGVANDTSAIQAAINAAQGRTLFYPSGTYKHGPVTVPHSVKIIADPAASIDPVFDAGTLQRLYYITGDDVSIFRLTINAVAGIASQNKYIFFADGVKRFVASQNHIKDATISDGNSGATNLLVCHGFYLNNAQDSVLQDNRIDTTSGAAIFLKTVSNSAITKNHVSNTGWYSINLDEACFDIDVSHNVVDGANTTSRYWGGSINIQSNTNGSPCARVDIRYNQITGVHNYGSAIRIQSLSSANVVGNQVYDVTAGSLAPGGSLEVQYISLDRRGTAEGSPENGPCRNVVISHNILTASGGPHQAIYLKNQYKATRDPHTNILVADNIIKSASANYFETAVSVHGYKSGFERLRIDGNVAEVLTDTGAPVSGAIGLVSTNSDGALVDVDVVNNIVCDISSAVPANTSQIGVYVQQTTQNARVQGNTLRNFFYGVRTASGAIITGVADNVFVACLNDTLDIAPSRSGWDYSRGTAIPVAGVYVLGHVRQKTDAAASASWGWVVTTAGGAMTAAWASGATYTTGTWYRNSAGRVYELITAGGGTTSVEPTHTTIGQDVTGADDYTWRCRATTSARWATLPALGAAVALP